jgi:hypothetical protein
LRHWRERYEQFGYEGLLDGRRRSPSAKRAPVAEVTRVVQLYRDTYRGFNARHFQDVDTASRCSDLMQRQLGQMSRVVEDLVDATRWARGKVALQKRRIDLRDVIRDAAADATSDVASAAGHFRQRHEWTDNLAGLALPTCWRTVAAPQVLHNRHLFERRL